MIFDVFVVLKRKRATNIVPNVSVGPLAELHPALAFHAMTNSCGKPSSSLNRLGIPCQLFAKFRLQRSVSDAGCKPSKNDLPIGFAFVFNECRGFSSLVVEG